MSDIENKIFEQLLVKLELPKNDQVVRKAKEIMDLIKIKNIGIISTLNENAKSVLCLDLASNLLNVPFNVLLNMHYKLAGLKKSAYQNNKKVLEKVLNLGKKLSISDVCYKHNIVDSNLISKATKLLDAFKETNCYKSNVDYDHPQYLTIAVFMACKLEKFKVSKKEFMNSINLKPNQWILLEKEMDGWLAESNFGKTSGTKRKAGYESLSNEDGGEKGE
jgi:hypothetical protein